MSPRLSMRRLMRYRRCMAVLVVVVFFGGLLMCLYLLSVGENEPKERKSSLDGGILLDRIKPLNSNQIEGKHMIHPDSDHSEEKIDGVTKQHQLYPEVNYDVHAFYYPWYRSPEIDGQYIHWNHPYLPHWDKKTVAKWPKGYHFPPDDIGASFYPELGPYSSNDKAVMEQHMIQLRQASVGVIGVSWYPPGQSDDNGVPLDQNFIPSLLEAAHKYDIKVCLHIEPFKNRSAMSLRHNLQYIHSRYGAHPAYYQYQHKGRLLPMFYLYDSYQVSREEWKQVLDPFGDLTVRGTELDAIFIGLLVERKHQIDLIYSGFDGFYTYFASDGFSYGSRISNWKSLAQEAEAKGILFIPSVGPGYIDERVRPWNAVNTKNREDGKYYERSWQAAIAARSPIVSITSFNEWHEGSQIEKAVPKDIGTHRYLDYSPHDPDYYLSLTRTWVHKYSRHK